MENEMILSDSASVMVSAGKPLMEEFVATDNFYSEPRPIFVPDVPKTPPTINEFAPNPSIHVENVLQTMTNAGAPRTDPSFNPEGVILTQGVLDYTAQTSFQANAQGNQTYTRTTDMQKGTDSPKTMVETAKEYALPIGLGIAGVGLLCWALMSGKPSASEKQVSGFGSYQPVQFKA